MMSIAESLALEKQLLDKYKNYPMRLTEFGTPNTNNNDISIISNTSSNGFNNEQRNNNNNFHRKVMIPFGLEEHEDGNPSRRVIWWWEPPANSTPKEFFADSSMHGLKYLSQPKRHLCERIFWLTFFITGIGFAGYLIHEVLVRYINNPVIVSFQPTDVDISFVVFPAVTICNMNKLRMEVVKRIESEYRRNGNPKPVLNAEAICEGEKSFANYFGYAFKRGKLNQTVLNDSKNADKENEDGKEESIKDFIQKETLSCDKIISLCRWAGEHSNCSLAFKDTITDYGRCCTFNGLPQHLLERDYPVGRLTKEEQIEAAKWGKWHNHSIFLLRDDWNSTYMPRTQSRPGSQYGLSIALNVNTEEFFCPSSDSEGFQMIIHPPSEMPQVRDFGFPIALDKEIFIKVIPELTVADDEIKLYDKTKRKCILRSDISDQLKYFNHYTRTNCVTECITEIVVKKCKCAFHYMPYLARRDLTREDRPRFEVCDPDPHKPQFNCSLTMRHNVSEKLNVNCSRCSSLCNDILYRTEVTSSKLQKDLWNETDPDPTMTPITKLKTNKVSIVHVFFGDLATLPKVRKSLYGISDIIANIGGLLGLCLGFSVLSAVEVIYFFTCRAFIKRMRRRTSVQNGTDDDTGQHQGHTFRRMIFGTNPEHVSRTITLNSNSLPFRPSYYRNN